MSSRRVYLALADAYPTEADARAAIADLDPPPGSDIAYHGVRVHPTPERPLVHLFADMTDEQVGEQGWMTPRATRGAGVSTYRTGNHQPQNIYRGDAYIGVMFTAEDAALVVEALNEIDELRDELRELRAAAATADRDQCGCLGGILAEWSNLP